VLGLPAFEDDGGMQFVGTAVDTEPVRREVRRVQRDRMAEPRDSLYDEPASFTPQPASTSKAVSTPKMNPIQKKTKK
jgi:hypothetical protein